MQPQYKQRSVCMGSWAAQNDPSPFSSSLCPRFESNRPRWTPGSHRSNSAPGSFERLLCRRQYGRLWGNLRRALLPWQRGMQPQQWAADVIQIWLDKINSLAFLELPFTKGDTFFKHQIKILSKHLWQWMNVTHCIFSTFRAFTLLSPQSYFYVFGFKWTGSPNLLEFFLHGNPLFKADLTSRYLPELASQASNGEITLKGEGRPDGIFSAKV